MNGAQETIYERITEIAGKIRDGAYGNGDDVDTEAINDDLDIATFEFEFLSLNESLKKGEENGNPEIYNVLPRKYV